jgi:hypothetical protein
MASASRLAPEVVVQVKTMLSDIIGKAAVGRPRPTEQEQVPAPVPGTDASGWHPYSSNGMSSQDERSGYPIWQPWAQMRLIEVIAAGSLVVVLFAGRDDGAETYVYSEDAAAYENLLGGNADADASFVARLVVAHLDEQMGGIGWQQAADRACIGRIAILTGHVDPRSE